MGQAAIYSLDHYREIARKELVREECHRQLDMFLDALEPQMSQSNPTLEDLTEVIFSRRNELMGQLTSIILKQTHAELLHQEYAKCPRCEKTHKARTKHPRTVETLVGPISFERPYFYCLDCQQGFYPLDRALDLSSRKKQKDLQKASCSLMAEIPYKPGSKLFQELTGMSLSDHTAHEIVAEVAGELKMLDVFPSAQEIRAKIEEVAKDKKWRPIMVMGIDGAHVPTRPEDARGTRPGRKNQRARRAHWKGQWQEAKGFRLYLIDGERIIHLASWHQVQTNEELAETLRLCKANNLIPEDVVRLCVIADGARWIWELVKELFPSAVAVLDFYHCSEHINKVATEQYPDDPETQQHWAESAITRLMMNDGQSVIWGLQHMTPHSKQAASEIAKLITYLKKNTGRIEYQSFRKGGYPIGSGGIESSNKFICHVRLKRSGAWWYAVKANDMLALRCAKYNGTFDRLFQKKNSEPSVKNT
jgi:hypothetical protein